MRGGGIGREVEYMLGVSERNNVNVNLFKLICNCTKTYPEPTCMKGHNISSHF